MRYFGGTLSPTPERLKNRALQDVRLRARAFRVVAAAAHWTFALYIKSNIFGLNLPQILRLGLTDELGSGKEPNSRRIGQLKP